MDEDFLTPHFNNFLHYNVPSTRKRSKFEKTARNVNKNYQIVGLLPLVVRNKLSFSTRLLEIYYVNPARLATKSLKSRF